MSVRSLQDAKWPPLAPFNYVLKQSPALALILRASPNLCLFSIWIFPVLDYAKPTKRLPEAFEAFYSTHYENEAHKKLRSFSGRSNSYAEMMMSLCAGLKISLRQFGGFMAEGFHCRNWTTTTTTNYYFTPQNWLGAKKGRRRCNGPRDNGMLGGSNYQWGARAPSITPPLEEVGRNSWQAANNFVRKRTKKRNTNWSSMETSAQQKAVRAVWIKGNVRLFNWNLCIFYCFSRLGRRRGARKKVRLSAHPSDEIFLIVF